MLSCGSTIYEKIAGHSYRSGKNGGVGVPVGSGNAVGTHVGGGVADERHGLL